MSTEQWILFYLQLIQVIFQKIITSFLKKNLVFETKLLF